MVWLLLKRQAQKKYLNTSLLVRVDHALVIVPIYEKGEKVFEFVGRSFELYPIYQNNGTATVIVDIGEGRMYRDLTNDDYVMADRGRCNLMDL